MTSRFVIINDDLNGDDSPWYVAQGSMRLWPIWTQADGDILRFDARTEAVRWLKGALAVSTKSRIVRIV